MASTIRSVWLALACSIAVGGCVAAVVGQGGAAGAAATSPADAQLGAAVRARLAAEPGLPVGAISVSARAGTVTLRGRVASAAQRAAAERVARSVAGVRAVVSELEVH
jgi:osmotically-inducible protein OsmY